MAKELLIERIFDAPISKVWKYWSEPEYFKRWWGPKDFTCPTANIEFKVGGKYLVAMRGPKGTEYDKDMWSTGVYREIDPFKKIVVDDSFSDENGNKVPSTEYGMRGFPESLEVILTFEEQDGKTKLTLNYPSVGDISEQDFNGMRQGWNQSLDKIEDDLRGSE